MIKGINGAAQPSSPFIMREEVVSRISAYLTVVLTRQEN